jgi:hypothetical protein
MSDVQCSVFPSLAREVQSYFHWAPHTLHWSRGLFTPKPPCRSTCV